MYEWPSNFSNGLCLCWSSHLKAIPSLVCLIYFTMPFVFRWFVNWSRSCPNDRLHISLYKIQNNFLRDSETATVIFTKTSKQGSDVSPVHANGLFENVTSSKLVYLIGQDRDNAHLYPTLLFFILRLKFDNDAMIKLGGEARLWNGPSLRGHKWRKGARFQKQNKMACEQTHWTSL